MIAGLLVLVRLGFRRARKCEVLLLPWAFAGNCHELARVGPINSSQKEIGVYEVGDLLSS
jgi:hypothetical protein